MAKKKTQSISKAVKKPDPYAEAKSKMMESPVPDVVMEGMVLIREFMAQRFAPKFIQLTANLWVFYHFFHAPALRKPNVHVAAFLYACDQFFGDGENFTQKEIAEHFEASSASVSLLWKNYLEFIAEHYDDVPNRFSVHSIKQGDTVSALGPELRKLVEEHLGPKATGQELKKLLGQIFQSEAEQEEEEPPQYWGIRNFVDEQELKRLLFECTPKDFSIEESPNFSIDVEGLDMAQVKKLLKLPKVRDTWIAYAFQIPKDLQGNSHASHAVIWYSVEEEGVLAIAPFDDTIASMSVPASLFMAIQSPLEGKGRRPSFVCLAQAGWLPPFRKLAKTLGFQVSLADKNQQETIKSHYDFHLRMLRQKDSKAGSYKPLAALQRLPERIVKDFLRVSGATFKQAFFETIREDQPIAVDLRAWGGPCYAVCSIGIMGESIALLCYRSLLDLLRFRDASIQNSAPKAFQQMQETFLSLTYEPLSLLPPQIGKVLQRRGWKLPLRDMFPDLMVMEPNQGFSNGTLEQYEHMIAICEAVLAVVQQHKKVFEQVEPPEKITLQVQSKVFPQKPSFAVSLPHPSLLDLDEERRYHTKFALPVSLDV